jgi:hypothetical protein
MVVEVREKVVVVEHPPKNTLQCDQKNVQLIHHHLPMAKRRRDKKKRIFTINHINCCIVHFLRKLLSKKKINKNKKQTPDYSLKVQFVRSFFLLLRIANIVR